MLKFVSTISRELNVHGLLNIQFVLRGGAFWIIEANPRASRTVPIASKISGLPLIDIAVGLALGEKLRDMPYGVGLYPESGLWGVKVPVFSNDKLPGLDPKLGPRMMSTGESLGMAGNLSDAIMEGLRGTGWTPPQAGRILMSIADSEKSEAMPVAALFKQLGWTVEATAGTAAYLKKWGIEAGCVEREDPRETAALRRLGPRAQHPRRKRAPHRRRHAHTPPRLLGRHPMPCTPSRRPGP